jgi:hypothetical protein
MWIWIHYLMRKATQSVLLDSAQTIHNKLFGPNVISDWVVSQESQIGNLASGSPISVTWHITEPQDSDFINVVIDLFNQPAQSSQMDLSPTLSKYDIGAQQVINTLVSSEKASADEIFIADSGNPTGTVEILEPTEGETCTAGQSITISIRGAGDTSYAGVVAFFGTSLWADIVQLPWEGDVNISLDSVGSAAQISVIGLDANMNMTAEDEVNLILESDIVLQEIFFGFGDTWYFDFKSNPEQSHQLQLYPLGRFSDGSEYPLSVLSELTTYETYDANIATVDANGLITVHSRGTTWIMVTCSERTSYLQIEVDSLIGDLNLNGMVDFSDFAILSGQWLQPPVIPSADIAPESRDGVVDLLDLAVFVEHWLEGL